MAEQQLHEWCLELLTKATGDRLPSGHTVAEDEYKWYGFGSAGYRNTDVVNSMIAFFYEHCEIPTDRNPCWGSGVNTVAVNKYMEWAKEHMAEEDWDHDVLVKARAVIPYIWRYRENPVSYLIECDYLKYSQITEFME